MNQMHLVALRRDLAWVTGRIPSGATLQASASPDQQYAACLHHGQRCIHDFQLQDDPVSTANHDVSLRVAPEAGDWRAANPKNLANPHVQTSTHGSGNITLEQFIYQAGRPLHRPDRPLRHHSAATQRP